VRDAALSRIRSAFESVGASSMPIFAYAPGGLQAAPASTERFAVWGQAFGAFGHVNSDGNAARLDRSSGGFFIGADGPVADHWRFGAFGGYSRSKFDADARNSSGSSDNYHAGVYGGGEWGALGLRYGGAYSWHDIDTARSVAFTGFSDRLTAGYRAGTAQVFGEVGYQLGAGGVRYEPFANLAYVSLRTDGFTEAGGAAALVTSAQTTDTTFTTLGLRAQTTLVASPSQTTLRGMLGWRHAFGDVVPASLLTFAAGGSAFTIAGVPIAEDALVLDAGFDVNLTASTTLGFSYGGQFGSGVTDQSLKANFAVKF
jgi:outer membrane autotransporter protein